MKPKLVARRTLAERRKMLECICQAEREYRIADGNYNPAGIDAVARLYRRFRRLVLRELR